MDTRELQKEKIKKEFAAQPDLVATNLRWKYIYKFAFIHLTTAVLIYLHFRYETFSWGLVGWAIALCLLGTLSIGSGYHRLFCHQSYKASAPLKFFFLFFGSSVRFYSALKWTNLHRMHHKYCDDLEKDPYSISRGKFYAHLGWLFYSYHLKHAEFLCPDLIQDPWVLWQHRYYKIMSHFHLYALPLLLGLYYHAPFGGLAFVGFLKLILSQHSIFCVNSFGHVYGNRTHGTHLTAADNPLIAFVSMGEGYHNYHHARPKDYRAGPYWYNLDFGKWFIFSMEKLGLAKNLHRAKIPNSV